MNALKTIEQEIMDESIHLKHLKFEVENGIYVVALQDLSGFTIVKGYGNTMIEAINDMHSCLI